MITDHSNKPTILIIDDELSIRESLSYMFEKKGYTVQAVNTGKEAIEQMKKKTFDVVLIDLKLPDVDGLFLLKEFKRDYPDTICIIISGYATVQNAINAIKEGADGYFTKPPIMDEVFLRVEESLTKQRLRRELRESEEKYRVITENANDLIVIMNEDLEIEYMNEKIHKKLLGYSKNEFLGKINPQFIHPDDLKRTLKLFKEVFIKGEGSGEVRFKHRNGVYIWVEFKVSAFTDRHGKKKSIIISRDITERKKEEEEMKKRLMKFDLKKGITYLVKESTPSLSIEAFKEVLKIGYHGLIISRTQKEDFEKLVEYEFKFHWLAEKINVSNSLKFDEIESMIEELPSNSVILLDRLDYLILKFGFNETISLIQRIRESIYLENQILIISIDPDTLDKQKLRLLEKEGKEIELRFMAKLPEDLLEIIRFVYQENNLGLKPSYSDIGIELKLSRPTVRKKMKKLISMGYLTENSKGRRKVIELLEKGRRLFST